MGLKAFLIWLISALALLSCEYEFNPLLENQDLHFSMYGVFDPVSDTNWVRVMPIRTTLFSEAEPPEALVTLTDDNSGVTVQLQDSIFSFTSINNDTFYARNYWTTSPIQYDNFYTIRAEYEDGRFSQANFYVPPSFTPPEISYNESTRSGLVEGGGVENLVIANVRYFVRFMTLVGPTPQNIIDVSQLERERVVFLPDNRYRFVVADMGYIADNYWNGDLSSVIVDSGEVFIGSASDDWPGFNVLTEAESALPSEVNNVENGVGLVTGISTVLVPLQSCFDTNDIIIPCPVKNR